MVAEEVQVLHMVICRIFKTGVILSITYIT